MPGRVAHGTYAHDLGRRHPFEVSMLAAALFVGASRVLAEPTSGSLEQALDPFLLNVWYGLLALSAVVTLVGVFWKDALAGLRVEQAGLISLIGVGLVYGGAITATSGLRGLAAAAFIFGFSVAATVRAWDIGRILSRIRALAKATEAVLNEGD